MKGLRNIPLVLQSGEVVRLRALCLWVRSRSLGRRAWGAVVLGNSQRGQGDSIGTMEWRD